MRTLSGLWIDRSARPTLQDQLARQIRERIRSGDLAPGDSLPDKTDALPTVDDVERAYIASLASVTADRCSWEIQTKRSLRTPI